MQENTQLFMANEIATYCNVIGQPVLDNNYSAWKQGFGAFTELL